MNLQQLERDFNEAHLRAIETRNRVTAGGRTPNQAEEAIIDGLNNEASHKKERLLRAKADAANNAQMYAITDRLMGAGHDWRPSGNGLGAQFVNGDQMRWLRETRHTRGGIWNSPASELIMPSGSMMATTLTEDSGSGGQVVVPHFLPTLMPQPTRPLRVADLIGAGVTESNMVTFLKESSWTNAAAATAEGAAKPESELEFVNVSEPVRKIATFLPVTEELLEDVAAMSAYLDSRLMLGVQLAEEDELLNGSGIAPHVNGFLARAGLTAVEARGGDSNADAVLKQIGKIQAAVFVRPDAVVMHPTNWQTMLLSKDAEGRYYGDAPFGATATSALWGAPAMGAPVPTLWGLPVAVTPAIAAGTALVGCFRSQAQLFRKGNLRVETSNSHADFFQKNLIAIRAELREALVIYKEAAFGIVSGLS